MSFHPAMATGSRERLHSSRSGAHHWEDEKLPTEPPTSQPQKATMSSYLSFLSPFTEEGKRRRRECAPCAAASKPFRMLVPATRGQAERRGLLLDESVLSLLIPTFSYLLHLWVCQ